MALSSQEFAKLQQKLQTSNGAAAPQFSGTVSDAPLGQRLSSDVSQAGNDMSSAFNNPAASPINQGVNAFASGANSVPKLASEFLPQPARQALDFVGNKVGEGFNSLQDSISNIPLFKEIGNLEAQGHINPKDNPGFYALKDMLGTSGGLGQTAGDVLTADVGLKAPIVGAKTVAAGAAPALRGTGATLKGVGEGLYGVSVNPSESTSRAMLAYDASQPTLGQRIAGMKSTGTKPITEANTAARKGIVGTEYGIGVSAKRVANDLWTKQIAPALAKSGLKVNMGNFFEEIEKEIKSSTPELGRRNTMIEALNSLRDDYKSVRSVGALKLQDYKSGWAKFLPDKVYNGKPIGAALKEVQDMAASKARGILHEAVGPEGKQAYIDWGNLQSIIESGIKSTTGDAAKKSLGRNVWQMVMDKAVTPITTVSGQVLYKTGEGLELLGKPGAKTVKDIVQ